MKLRALWGELLLCLVFIGAGAFWIAASAGMQMWDGFAPASGFLPLIFGVLLVVMAIAATVVDVVSAKEGTEVVEPIRRPVIVLLALGAGVAGIEIAGFFASMFLATLYLFRYAEKLPLVASLAVSFGTAAVLTVVFRSWLGVPLPAGPWGF